MFLFRYLYNTVFSVSNKTCIFSKFRLKVSFWVNSLRMRLKHFFSSSLFYIFVKVLSKVGSREPTGLSNGLVSLSIMLKY